MKLVLCARCWDVYKLDTKVRQCKCLGTSGYYLDDGWHAVINGADAVPIGFANSSLANAIKTQSPDGQGVRFEAFVIPPSCDTIDHQKRHDDDGGVG